MKRPSYYVKLGIMLAVVGFALAMLCACPDPPHPPDPPNPPDPPIVIVKPDPGPPYFGASCYQAIGFEAADVEAFLANNAKAGGNATEFFFVFGWDFFQPSGGCWHSPCLQVGTYRDPGNAEAAGIDFPLFDLTKPNEATWAKWRSILAACKKYGQTPFFRLEDGVSYKYAVSKRAYLFRANTDRINADGSDAPNRRWYNWEGGYEARRLEIMRWLVTAIAEAGISDYYFVPMNEAYIPDATADDMAAWHSRIVADLHSLGVADSRIVLNTGLGYDQTRAALPALRWEHHGCASPQRMEELKAQFGANINFNGDGPDKYAAGIGDGRPGYAQPSVDQAREMGAKARAWGAFAVLFYARQTELTTPAQIKNVDQSTWDVVRALSGK